jgi:hypothetical protein
VCTGCSILAQLNGQGAYWFGRIRAGGGSIQIDLLDLAEPKENSMYKSIAMIAGAAAILSLGSLVSAQAGGGATSAPSRYNNAAHTASVDQTRNFRRVHAVSYTITEFSSSSARASVPKR